MNTYTKDRVIQYAYGLGYYGIMPDNLISEHMNKRSLRNKLYNSLLSYNTNTVKFNKGCGSLVQRVRQWLTR